MENIGQFLDACYAYGLEKNDMFQTVDLYDNTNIPQVSMYCITVYNMYCLCCLMIYCSGC